MIFAREALGAPRFPALEDGLRRSLLEQSRRLPSLSPLAARRIGAVPDRCFLRFRHRLSEPFIALNGERGECVRSEREAEAFQIVGSRLTTASSARQFADALALLNTFLTDGRGGWRTGQISLDGDRRGNRVLFPPAETIPGQLDKLWFVCCGADVGPAMFRAIVAQVLLVNCHPFRDGNGRVSRFLFNHLLRRGGMPDGVYLPFYEIAIRSRGGYEIALRNAELRRDWRPIINFGLEMIECCRQLAGPRNGRPVRSEAETGPASAHGR